MSFNLRPGTSLFGNITFTPGTNENYVAPPVHQGPPPMTVGWSNAGLSESERVAPAANGMQLYRYDQPYTNAHPNRTLHNLPEYLEGLPFTVESAQAGPENGIEGTPHSLEEYTFNTSGTLYLILRADWGGYVQNPMGLQQLTVPTSDTSIGTGVLDPSAWTSVEDSVGYMGGGGDYGTYVFSRSVEAGTYSLNNLYYYAFKADAPAPAAPEPAPEQESLVELYLNATDSDVVDSSSNSHTFTTVGSISVVNDSPYSTGKSMSFGGSGSIDCLRISAAELNTEWNNNFTIESWIYPTQSNGFNVAFGQWGPAPRAFAVGVKDGKFYFTIGDSAVVYNGSNVTLNQWHHLAFVNNNGTLGLYVNGVLDASQTASIGLSSTNDFAIGARFDSLDKFDGYISDLRYTKTAVYTENFSVPTEPVGDYTVAVESPAPSPAPDANWVAVGARSDDDNGTNSGSVYVYDANDLSAQPTKLTAFDGTANDKFGSSVAVTADKIVVGAYFDDDRALYSGSIYVYDANDLTAQSTKLTAFDAAAVDNFGISVAVASDKIVVGSQNDDDNGSNSGAVYVYDANDLSAQPTKLTAFDGAADATFGNAVDANDEKIVVGAMGDQTNGNLAGAVYVYDANNLSAQPTKLTAFDGAANDKFGSSVATTANKIFVGAWGDDGNGSVYVYDANDLSAQPTKLTSFDGAAEDRFGSSVAATADKIVVGAYFDDDNGSRSGSVYVYDANDLSAQPTKLTSFDGAADDYFGHSVATNDDKIIVGAYGDDDNGSGSGSVYVYDANDLSAQPTKLTAFDGAAGDGFGLSVALG